MLPGSPLPWSIGAQFRARGAIRQSEVAHPVSEWRDPDTIDCHKPACGYLSVSAIVRITFGRSTNWEMAAHAELWLGRHDPPRLQGYVFVTEDFDVDVAKNHRYTP